MGDTRFPSELFLFKSNVVWVLYLQDIFNSFISLKKRKNYQRYCLHFLFVDERGINIDERCKKI